MRRRDIGLGILSLTLIQRATAALQTDRGPRLYLASRRNARVFLLGFGDAKDDDWATPFIRRTLQSSSELWLEVSHEPGAEPDAASKREQLTHDPAGRSFFDVLEPQVRTRVIDYCAQLEIPKEKLAAQRPWSAFYTINGAYWSRHKPSFEPRNPDETLMKLAKDAGKPVRYEMPNQLEFARFMAAMPDAAQSQYITFLLDFFDDQAAGRNHDEFGWAHGDTKVGERAVERMRTRTPDLYRIMQVQRNAWWAQTVDRLLSAGGTHLIGIGQMHVLGPDGIPRQLERRGIGCRTLLSSSFQ
jgi:uncharacterized protein YbaP (TraB family)